MPYLSENEFKASFAAPMRQLSQDAEPPFDFWAYYEAIPVADFEGHTCAGNVTYVWEHPSGTFQHVLINSEDKNVFMVIVLNASNKQVVGHRLLDLPAMYGLNQA